MIRAAVLGSPISHSLSPILHQEAYRILGIEGSYEAIEVGSGELPQFISTAGSSWTGFSLTMPLKEEILKVATSIDPLAMRIHSANTLIATADGWRASSTDVLGFSRALQVHGLEDTEDVLILGSGATARAAVAACDLPGRRIRILHRSTKRETAIRACAQSAEISFLPWQEVLPFAQLTINTTPVGAADLFVRTLPNVVGNYFESLYHPWPTGLLGRWQTRGVKTIDGLDLLVEQAIEQVVLMSAIHIDSFILAPQLRSRALLALEK